MIEHFDVIVVGSGHAGCEAAHAAAKLGAKTAIMTLNIDSTATMPCNPAVGGPAKSNLVREIDALGGIMGIIADETYLQMKMLNSSKGPAVQALRAQSDKKEYSRTMHQYLESVENLHFRQGMVVELIVNHGIIKGVTTNLGLEYGASAVIITTGTFLNGKIHIGTKYYSAGRSGEFAAVGLTECLQKLGFETIRLKTGTPARVDGRTIDFSSLEVHPGDTNPQYFSFLPNRPVRKQYPCYMTRTTAQTHTIIMENLDKSPIYSGLISGVGPRYCPSIEDKVVRFADKESHSLFIEPEGKDSYEMYMQGFSTSLPAEVQVLMIRSLPGLEVAEIIRPGYAVEYDSIPATQLDHSLMTKKVKGLFCAGQINGTSGYEEASAQGIVAGINAVKYLAKEEMMILSRASSYIGTLVDDLVTKEIQEPYRMLTSRSEYRLLLRQDNADERMTPIGYKVGLVDEARWNMFCSKREIVKLEIDRLHKTRILPTEEINAVLGQYGESIQKPYTLAELIKRPHVTYDMITQIDPDPIIQEDFTEDIKEQVEIQIKYEGYIARQNRQIEQFHKTESIKIPDFLDFFSIKQLSNEAKEKLARIRPVTVGQASRIAGVTPADISALLVILESLRRKKVTS